MPYASVIMTTYNVDLQFTRDAIDSVLGQAMNDLELIVVDDCSTNGVYELALDYAAADSRVKVLRLDKNSGSPSRPRNRGIAAASGEIVSFMDGDDIDHAEKLATAKQIFDNHPDTDLVFSDIYAMSQEGISEDTATHEKTGWLSRAASYLDEIEPGLFRCSPGYIGLMARNPRSLGISTQGIVVRRRSLLALDQWFPEDYRLCEDSHLWFRLAENCRMVYVHRGLSYYRQLPNSSSARQLLLKTEAGRLHQENYRRLAHRLRPDERQAYRCMIATVLFEAAYLLRQNPRECRRYLRASWKHMPRLVTATAFAKSLARSLLPASTR